MKNQSKRPSNTGNTAAWQHSTLFLLTTILLSHTTTTAVTGVQSMKTSTTIPKYGYQSGSFPTYETTTTTTTTNTNTGNTNVQFQPFNDDSYASSMYYSPSTNLLYVTGGTYSRFWDGPVPTDDASHLEHSDCFVSVFSIPITNNAGTTTSTTSNGNNGDNKDNGLDVTTLYARRFGESSTPEVCSSLTVLPTTNPTTTTTTTTSISHSTPLSIKLIAMGHTQEKGLLTSLRGFGNPKSSIYGFLLDVDIELKLNTGGGGGGGLSTSILDKVNGGHLMNDDDSAVEYPVALAVSGFKGAYWEDGDDDGLGTVGGDGESDGDGENESGMEDIYVATMSSVIGTKNTPTTTTATTTTTTTTESTTNHEDISAAGGIIKATYGSDFRIAIQKKVYKSESEMEYTSSERSEIPNHVYTTSDLQYQGVIQEEGGVRETIKTEWTKYFSTALIDTTSTGIVTDSDLQNDDGIMDVQVSDLLYIPIQNNNNNEGDEGNVQPQQQQDILAFVGSAIGDGEDFGGVGTGSGHDFDGFVTKLDPATGNRLDATFTNSTLSKASTRIGVTGSNEFIRGACFEQGVDSVTHLYVVGETTGVLDTVTESFALSTSRGGKVGKHAFITKIYLHTMEHVWTRQLGSVNGRDVLSYSCAVSKDDHKVFVGGTVKDGDYIQTFDLNIDRDSISSAGNDDVFVASFAGHDGRTNFIQQFGTSKNDVLAKGSGITLDKNGNVIVLGNTQGSMMRFRGDDGNDESGGTRTSVYDVFMVSIGKDDGEMRTIFQNRDRSDDSTFDEGLEKEEEEDNVFGVGEAIAVTSVILTMSIILFAGYKILNGGSKDHNEEVIDFAENFKDDYIDIHIRHSATGGVHGIYDFKTKKSTRHLSNDELSYSSYDDGKYADENRSLTSMSSRSTYLSRNRNSKNNITTTTMGRESISSFNDSQKSGLSWDHSRKSSPTLASLHSSRNSRVVPQSYVTNNQFGDMEDDWDKTIV